MWKKFTDFFTLKTNIKKIKFKLKKLISSSQDLPIWFMRQAGRYLPEYRELRKDFSNFMEFCVNADATHTATMQPIKRFDLDAAIIFSDILTIPHFLGFEVDFQNGPYIKKTLTNENLKDFDKQKIKNNFKSLNKLIRETKKSLMTYSSKKSLIGFSGAPWTIFCYMISERIDKSFLLSRKVIYEQPKFFTDFIEKITEIIYEYLVLQIESGVNVVKIFDSWASVLSYDEFQKFCLMPMQAITTQLKKNYPDVEIICFPKGISCTMALEFAKKVKCDILATSYNMSLDDLSVLQNEIYIQSNLDPMLLAFDLKQAILKTKSIIEKLKKPFVFNLGHGILKETPPENVQNIVNLVRSLT